MNVNLFGQDFLSISFGEIACQEKQRKQPNNTDDGNNNINQINMEIFDKFDKIQGDVRALMIFGIMYMIMDLGMTAYNFVKPKEHNK